MKHTASSLTIKHKHGKKIKKKSSQFVKNRKEEELEQEGKAKHAIKKKMACKTCGSMAHAMHPKHATKKKAARKLQTQNARYEKMRKQVFGIKV